MYSDPIADLLTRIRNGGMMSHSSVLVPVSKVKGTILDTLQREGYIASYSKQLVNKMECFSVVLKYCEGAPVISVLKRISKCGCRVYRGTHELKDRVLPGIFVLSTSRGVMSSFEAISAGLGGEVICYVF
jgi:small subunit ribosomal protein S8